MKWRHLAIGCLILVVGIVGLLSLGVQYNQAVPAGVADPSFEFYTKGHSNRFAAVERWAHYGMRAQRVVDVLQKSGYKCQPLSALKHEPEPSAIRETLCSKTETWPLKRTLSIRAGIEYGIVARLVSIEATSTLTPANTAFTRQLAAMLRKFDWMEPESLPAAGFRIDSIETLSRMVADTLSPMGWYQRCKRDEDSRDLVYCKARENERVKSGFPALPHTPLPTGTARELFGAMEGIDFTPLQQRGADGKPEDSLLVRSANGRMWIDFGSKDMIGRELSASVELESKGGKPINVVLTMNGESKSFALAGVARLANDGAFVFLLPEADAQDGRYALWLHLPKKERQNSFEQLARALAVVDGAFIAPMIEAIIGDPAIQNRPEERLGLYPPLQQIEQKAELLRALQTERWLPRENGNRLIAATYPDQPVIRAAWAFATCESPGPPAAIDAACLRRFSTADPDAAALVHGDIAKLALLYGGLPEDHPIRIRLRNLSRAFSF